MEQNPQSPQPVPAQPHREEAIFHAARTLPVPDRAAYLKAACGADSQLRARIENLLDSHGRAGDFLETLPAGAPSSSTIVVATPPSEKPGDQIGHYKIREQIGEGGCGVVYVAEQTEPVRRRVALKVIKLGMDTKSVIARFEAERQALAMMDHPNIARVLDAGATETGRPYFVMELVRGIKITDYCDQNNLNTTERIELFVQVCHAVQHAHQKGIIHRDIKPSNILVTLHDGVPVPKVIDFGIAKATEGRLTDLTIYTELHQFIGTPAYMSPEQAEMSGLDVDTRSDIYSLGVLLYELLTGRTPFDPQELARAGLDQMRRTIREQEPLRPSTRLSTLLDADLTAVAKRHGAEAPRLVYLIRGDLDWIVMKALEKDRTRRFETANALAADLQRFLKNDPVEARPPSSFYRFQKSVRRNKTIVAAAGAVFAALVVGFGLSLYLFIRERAALAREALMRAQAERGLVIERKMRQIAPIGEKLNQAGLLLSQGQFGKAEEQVQDMPLLVPASSAVFNVLGDHHARKGEWLAAITNFDRSVRVDPTNHWGFNYLAPLLVTTGQIDSYNKLREQILAQFGTTSDPNVAERMAKACLILPPPAPDFEKLDRMVNIALSAGSSHTDWPFFQFLKGLAEYRQGHFEAAIEPLQSVVDKDGIPSRTAEAYCALAMAQYRQQQAQPAHASLEAGRKLFHEKLAGPDVLNWNDRLIAQALMQEATALIEPTAAASATHE